MCTKIEVMPMVPRLGDLARARILAEIFRPHDLYQARVRLSDGRTVLGRVWAASAEGAGHRAAIAGEVLGVERMV